MNKTYENFEEWLKEHDEEIRADERQKCMNETKMFIEKHSVEIGEKQGIRKFAEFLEKKDLLINIKFSGDSNWDRLSSKDVIAKYEKEQENDN